MERIGVGRQAEVYDDGSGLALKVYYEQVPRGHIELEADRTAKAAALFDRACGCYGLQPREGTADLRLELIHGDMLFELMSRHIFRIFRYAREMGALQREMHAIRGEGLPSAREKFGYLLKAYHGLEDSDYSRLMDFITQAGGDALCHGDLHPYNIMVERQGRMRVIDWVDAYAGDPLSDVARTCYLITRGASVEKKSFFITAVEAVARRAAARAYLRSYLQGSRLPKREFAVWQLIIQIARYHEGIREELPRLEKSIAKGLRNFSL